MKWRDPEVQALCGFLFRIVGVFFTGFYACVTALYRRADVLIADCVVDGTSC